MALAVVAILAGLGAPALGALMARHKLAAISNELLALVTLARNEALQRQTRVTLCRTADPNAAQPICTGPGSSWAQGILVFVDNGAQSPPQPARRADILRVASPFDPQYRVQRNGLSTPHLSFAPNGRLKSGTLGVSFDIVGPRAETAADSEKYRCLVIAITGRTRLLAGRCA